MDLLDSIACGDVDGVRRLLRSVRAVTTSESEPSSDNKENLLLTDRFGKPRVSASAVARCAAHPAAEDQPSELPPTDWPTITTDRFGKPRWQRPVAVDRLTLETADCMLLAILKTCDCFRARVRQL